MSETTAHIDMPTTLLEEVFGCGPAGDDSNGRNLFGAPGPPRPLVVGGYVNHGFMMGEDVHAVFPPFLRSCTFADTRGPAGPPDANRARQAIEETRRFFGVRSRTATVAHRASIWPPEAVS